MPEPQKHDFSLKLARVIAPKEGPGVELATLEDAARFMGHMRPWRHARPHWKYAGQVRRLIDGSLRESWMSDVQIAMRAAKIDRIRATRRFGAFAVLTLRTIEKIRAGRMTASEAARHFEQMARTHRLRETGHYDPKLVDMLIARVWQSRKEERRTWGEAD